MPGLHCSSKKTSKTAYILVGHGDPGGWGRGIANLGQPRLHETLSQNIHMCTFCRHADFCKVNIFLNTANYRTKMFVNDSTWVFFQSNILIIEVSFCHCKYLLWKPTFSTVGRVYRMAGMGLALGRRSWFRDWKHYQKISWNPYLETMTFWTCL